MENKKKPNVFCVLVDGNRTKPGKDMHSRLNAFDQLGQKYIGFNEVITSASSTLMSFAGIITGSFAYDLFPCFFSFTKYEFKEDNYFRKFKEAGYNVQSTVFYDVTRIHFLKEINAFQESKNNRFLGHEEMLRDFKFLVENKWDQNKPNFIFCHAGFYENGDWLVSEILQFLKNKSLFEDSIFILCSDHGYIDYGRFHYLGWLLHPKVHSLYVDEDTLRTNLAIHLPESVSKVEHKIINSPVCVIDIFETVLDYLGIDRNIKIDGLKKRAVSFKPLIETDSLEEIKKADNRLIRSDTRYLFQNYNQTSIRNRYYKLISNCKKSRFFRLNNGQECLIKRPSNVEKDKLSEFKSALAKYELEARPHIFQMTDLLYSSSSLNSINNKHIGIYNFANKTLLKYLRDKLSKNNQVEIVDLQKIKRDYLKYDFIICIINNSDFFHYIRFLDFVNKKGIAHILLNLGFEEQKFNKYLFWNDLYNQAFVINKRLNFFLKLAILFVLSFIKIQSWFNLKNNPDNYYSGE